MTERTLPAETNAGKGFAWFHQHAGQSWVINIAGGYGAFTFEGSEAEAEEMRVHKTQWEGNNGHKRPASVSDYPQASHCWNHPGYLQTRRPISKSLSGKPLKRPFMARFYCDCGSCL